MTVERWEALLRRSGPLWAGLAFCFATTAVLWHFTLDRLLDASAEARAVTPERTPEPPLVTPSIQALGASADRAPMVLVPEGIYQPFYKDEAGGKPIPVAPFLLDELPVSRADFLEFVRQLPSFRKSRVERLFAEKSYLADWPSDLDAGPDLEAPVTHVSWFAAKAYCERRGKRLPTTAEWERTAGKAAEAAPARLAQGQSPFRFAMGKAESEAGAVRGFGSIWEWTSDFNSVLVSGRLGDSDGATGSAFCGDGVRATNPSDYGAFLRYSFRASLKADYTLKRLGFRCAKQPY